LRPAGYCITSDYMAATKVMTLRIEPELLEELREIARVERRSVSAQVLLSVRRDIEARTATTRAPRRSKKPLPIRGWLRRRGAPETTVEDVRSLRRSLTRQIEARLRKYPKGK
jgi:hypothetical protein